MSESQVGALVVAAVLVLLATTFEAMVRAVRSGRLRRNAWFGVRIPSTMATDEAWDAGHRAAVPYLRVAALASGAGAVTSVALLPRAAPTGVVAGVVATLVVIVVSIAGARAAHRAAADAG